MDMGHDETVHVGDRLCIDLASAHNEATGIPDLIGNVGSRRGSDGICFRQRRYDHNTFRSFKATGNDDIESLRERTSYGLECLAAHDDRTAHGRALEELQILGNMPQESIVLSNGIIVRYRYYDAFFHFQWFWIPRQARDDSEEITPLPEPGYVDMDHNQPARSLRT